MRVRWLAAVATILVFTAPPSAAGAQGANCSQVRPADAQRIVVGDEEIVYFSDPVRVICPDGIQIEADSAVMNRSAGTVELVGSVLYRDGDRQLIADWARFLEPTEVLFARGAVVLTDLSDGSVINGDDFEYHRQTEERPESHMIMRGLRPHAVLRSTPGSDPDRQDGGVSVWAQRMEMLGETVFLARTDVEFERHDFRGAADAVRFDQGAETMSLSGDAHVETDEYRLDGEQIDADMRADTLREVTSQRAARLVAEDLTLRGLNIRIGFADGQPERVEAWNPAAVPADAEVVAPPRRALAISRDFQLRADSIDARSVEGRIREVRAVGRAYGEREADTLSVNMPDAIARDWIQGDTITAYFLDEPASEAEAVTAELTAVELAEVQEAVRDSAQEGDRESQDAVLDRIEVVGGSDDALSLYRTQAPGENPRPSVNFVRAERITLFMKDGEVDHVDVDGPLEGLYLDPVRPGTRATTGSTQPDRRAAR